MKKPNECPGGCTHTNEEHSAFDAGVKAGRKGKPESANPHKHNVALHEAWLSGHSVGFQDRPNEAPKVIAPTLNSVQEHITQKATDQARRETNEFRKLVSEWFYAKPTRENIAIYQHDDTLQSWHAVTTPNGTEIDVARTLELFISDWRDARVVFLANEMTAAMLAKLEVL